MKYSKVMIVSILKSFLNQLWSIPEGLYISLREWGEMVFLYKEGLCNLLVLPSCCSNVTTFDNREAELIWYFNADHHFFKSLSPYISVTSYINPLKCLFFLDFIYLFFSFYFYFKWLNIWLWKGIVCLCKRIFGNCQIFAWVIWQQLDSSDW